MAKRKRTTQTPLQGEDTFKVVQLIEYEITDEPIQDRQYKRLPARVKKAFEQLHAEAQKRPYKAIPELLGWIEKYPNIPILYNYLAIAYSGAGQQVKAEEVIRENYRQNPDYLFARINYAELCRAKGDYDRIADIFEHKFDLKLLYPNRKRFHISEVANFMGFMGIYFFETGKQEIAETYYDFLKQIAPGYPMTKLLRRKLHPSFFRRMFRRLIGKGTTAPQAPADKGH